MLIEIVLRRSGMRFTPGKAPYPFVGSEVELPGQTYHFRPQPELVRATGIADADESAHVCEVVDEAHIRRLLEIPGYRPFGAAEAPPAPAAPREVIGQPEVVEELLPDDEEAESPGWATELLQQPLAQVRAAVASMPQSKIRVLIEAELADRARRKYLDALADVADQAA